MSNGFLSKRVKRRDQSGITSDRYEFLGLDQAEPDLGDPIVGPSSVVANPFTGEKIELTAVELSLYDFIMGCNMVFANAPKRVNDEMIKDFDRALTWFRINNPQAYMVLLD